MDREGLREGRAGPLPSARGIESDVPEGITKLQFDAVYSSFGRAVERYLLGLGHPAPGAADLKQETFIRILRGLEEYRGGSVAGWVFAIARSVHLEHLRRRSAQKRGEEEAIPEGYDAPDRERLPIEALVLREDADVVRRAIKELPPQMQRIVRLYYGQGRSCEEVSRILGIGASTVKSTLRDVRKRLRASLKPQPEEVRHGT